MEEPGTVINERYRIVERLGEGAFGITYRARDEVVDKSVVVKISRTRSNNDAAERFKREARTLAKIYSQHIARFLDFGMLPDGTQFLVVDDIGGRSLQLILGAGALPISDALAVAEAVAKGLAAAHEAGVIHRDIKPSNIILPERDAGPEFERATLVDFGILGELEESTGLTRTGQVFGTPFYMSPEQFRGDRQSPASDVYGLGAVLFQMIFGHPPFSDPNPTRTIVMSLTAEVVIPAAPVIPQALRSFILESLSKDPKNRPNSGIAILASILEIRALLAPGAESKAAPRPPDGESNSVLREPDLVDVSARSVPAQTVAIAHAAPIEMSLPGRSSFAGLVIPFSSIVSLVLAAVAAAVLWTNPYQSRGIVVGILLAVAGVSLGFALQKWFETRKSQLQIDAGSILEGTQSRVDLSKSIAFEVDQLIVRVRRLDERILAQTMAVMLAEYQAAVESHDRQAALMNVSQLLEKLMARLSPWYIRHEKLIAFGVSLIGVLSGAASILLSILKMTQGK